MAFSRKKAPKTLLKIIEGTNNVASDLDAVLHMYALLKFILLHKGVKYIIMR